MLGGFCPRIIGNNKKKIVCNHDCQWADRKSTQVIDEFNRYLIWKPHLPKKLKKIFLTSSV